MYFTFLPSFHCLDRYWTLFQLSWICSSVLLKPLKLEISSWLMKKLFLYNTSVLCGVLLCTAILWVKVCNSFKQMLEPVLLKDFFWRRKLIKSIICYANSVSIYVTNFWNISEISRKTITRDILYVIERKFFLKSSYNAGT